MQILVRNSRKSILNRRKNDMQGGCSKSIVKLQPTFFNATPYKIGATDASSDKTKIVGNALCIVSYNKRADFINSFFDFAN